MRDADLINGPWALDERWLPAVYHALRNSAPLHQQPPMPDPVRDGATVIIPLQGVMTPRGGGFFFGGASTIGFMQAVQSAAANPKIGAIVLDIASPGGSTYGVEEAAQAVFAARQVKPVVAVANHMTMSAAYHVASQASAFYVSPSADVGSVGVYSMHVDQSKALDDFGVKVTLIHAGPKKVDGNPFEPLSERARADIQASVDDSYRIFLAAIARGRGEQVGDVEAKHGQGAPVVARAAVSAGMVDGLMTLSDAVTKFGSSRSRLALMRRRAEANQAFYAL